MAGGMESMSQIPFMLQGARAGFKYGDQKLVDGVSHDGLSDAYSRQAMGCIDRSERFGITRKDQDDFARESYARAHAAQKVRARCAVLCLGVSLRSLFIRLLFCRTVVFYIGFFVYSHRPASSPAKSFQSLLTTAASTFFSISLSFPPSQL